MGSYEGKPTISFSAWAQYSHCPFLYSKEKIDGFVSKVISEDLRKGDVFHHLVYRYALNYVKTQKYPDYSELQVYAQEWLDKKLSEGGSSILPDEFRMPMEDSLRLTAHNAIRMVQKALEFLQIQNYDIVVINGVPGVEYEFFIPFDSGDTDCYFGAFHGLIDLILRDKRTGEIFILDYKTTKTLKSSEDEEVRIQLGLYQSALQRLGIEVSGTLTFQVLSKAPAIPELLKKGGMSRKYIVSDWETYKYHLEQNGFDPEDYSYEMIEKLSTVEFHRLTKVYRNQTEIYGLWYDVLLPVVFEISDLIKNKKQFRRHLNSFLCGKCIMREVCLGELRGHDVSYLLETMFTKRKEVEEEIEEAVV